MGIILKEEKCDNILKEINNEIKAKLNGINKDIEKIVKDLNNKIINMFEEVNKEIMNFSLVQLSLQLPSKLDSYLFSEKGDKNNNSNLMEKIYSEIKCVKNLSKIYGIKGFGNYIKSSFSNYHYIINNIDILLQNFLKTMDTISKLLIDKLIKYIKEIIDYINKAYSLPSIKFTNEQSTIWEIEDYYCTIKSQIEQAKNYILKNI